LPVIAPPLGLTTAALYERQRALVRLGLLPTPQGRGRGSGADATPDNVALLIITRLLTDNLSEVDDRVMKLAKAPFIDQRRTHCQWTGKRIFKDALSALLLVGAPGDNAGCSTSVAVSRFEPSASISIFPLADGSNSQFGRRRSYSDRDRIVQIEAELPDEALRIIRSELNGHLTT
jgi:hypothetical protein